MQNTSNGRGDITQTDKPRYALIERISGKIIHYFDKINYPLRWMPDSKSIIYADPPQEKFWRQSVRCVEPKPFADFHLHKISSFDFSPDGKQII